MSDQELIALLEQGAGPDDLSIDQLELLRSRVRESRGVREALREQLRFRSAMTAAIAPVNLPIAGILGQAAATLPTSSISTIFGWGASTMGVMLLATLAVLHVRSQPAQTAVPPDPYAEFERKIGSTHQAEAPKLDMPPADNSLVPGVSMPEPMKLDPELPIGPLPSPSDDIPPLEPTPADNSTLLDSVTGLPIDGLPIDGLPVEGEPALDPTADRRDADAAGQADGTPPTE